jgi:hypothetical protein
MYSPSRRPPERDGAGGVTIDEIESEVSRLCPYLRSDEEMRAKALIFAILKQGCAIQKLLWFTKYEREFLLVQLDNLRADGQLFTGQLSVQYVLKAVPGCKDLIERVTGQRIVAEPATARPAPLGDWEKNLVRPPVASSTPRPAAKPINRKEEKPMNNEVVNGAAAAPEPAGVEPTCLKTPGCPRPAGHNGICKGQKVKRRAAAAKAKPAKTPRVKASKPKPARYGRKPQPVDAYTATATAMPDPGYFKIEFEDGEDTISREGHGREGFARALKALHQEFAGGSNG